MAAIARLGDSLYAMHYVCPGIGKLALMDKLAAFSNQTARFRDVGRAFVFAGNSYRSVLCELDCPMERKDTRLLTYGGAERPVQPAPDDVPEWDAMFQGMPFLMATDMDLRRINTAIRTARSWGFEQIAMAALEGQAEQVLFPGAGTKIWRGCLCSPPRQSPLSPAGSPRPMYPRALNSSL